MKRRARRNASARSVDIQVVRFLDTRTSARWFQRRHETLGYVTEPVDDDGCFDERGLLAYVAREFGRDADAIYFNPCAPVRRNPTSERRVFAQSEYRYRASAAERRAYGGATVTQFLVGIEGSHPSTWKTIMGYGPTPGERKTDAIKRFLEGR